MPVLLIAIVFWGGGIYVMEKNFECVGNPTPEVSCLVDGVKDSLVMAKDDLSMYIRDTL